ncbi:MAG: hypothetical protein ACE5GQ_07170 [Nitrospinales bacterium]
MYEVKVYDSAGSLKKVISVKTLNKRTESQINFPSLYKKNRKKIKLPAKAPKNAAQV